MMIPYMTVKENSFRMKKILFVTGTRADYGKIKPLIKSIENSTRFEAYIFVSGMHLIEHLGNTYSEILKDQYRNVHVDFSQINSGIMSYDLGNVICNLTGYIRKVKPDMMIVHGDRVDALAGAIVGALNNIKVVHIEGGELSGTIDESIRHAITKFAHVHFVSNTEAKQRLIQLGESEDRIYVLGSPDIDIMLSDALPSIEEVKERYAIPYERYAIFMYHPVTTEFRQLPDKIKDVVSALLESKRNYVLVYPNNDLGSEIILNEYRRLYKNEHFKLYPSLRFEYFLTLLKHADFIIGNSSAGVREAGIYGIPAIDIGTRQTGRYEVKGNIQHTEEEPNQILSAIHQCEKHRVVSYVYGRGNSTKRFMEILEDHKIWDFELQKNFIDLNSTI